MSVELLENFTRQFIAAHQVPEVTFTWQGGEPTLMGLSFFEKAVALQRKYKRSGQVVSNSLQTNGFLLNDDWGRFLADQHFLAGISLDGPRHYHDTYRKSKTGEGTYNQVIAGLEVLKKYKVETNILACVNSSNVSDPLGVYRHFRDDLEMTYLQFIPIVERANASGNQKGEKLTNRSITGTDYGNFLITIFDEWIQKDVGNVFVQLFETCLGVYLGLPATVCVFSETCGACLAVEHTGDLYSCDHYVQPDALLGNIKEISLNEMVFSRDQAIFGSNKKTLLSKKCLHCDVHFICNGDCLKNRIIPAVKGDYPISHLCEGYYSFFKHIDKPMKTMVSLFRSGQQISEISRFTNS